MVRLLFAGVDPEMPAPSGCEGAFKRSGKEISDQGEPALVQEMVCEIDVRKVPEKLARFLMRIYARKWVAGAVCMLI
jgi:hypothetical protein